MKNDILKEISRANLALLEQVGVTKTYEKIAKELQRLMKSHYTTIFLHQDGVLKRVYTSVPAQYRMKPRKDGNTRRAIKELKPYIVNESQIRKSHPEAKQNIKTIIIMPLTYGNKAIGALTIQYRNPVQISRQHLNILHLYTSAATFAIQNAILMKDLKRTLAVRDLFISTASHEFKTPITAISLYTQLLKKSIDRNKSIDNEWIFNLSEQVSRLNSMLEDFLSLEKMRMDELVYHMNAVHLNKLIQKAIENFRIKHGARKLEFISEVKTTGDTIKGDFDKLLQVINNILNNAAKFSPQKSMIAITLNGSDGRHLKIAIKDEGIGIKKKDIKKVFQKYFTTKVKNKEGMGIGMYLTKKIVEKHNGQIRVHSERKKGTTVLIVFPRLS